MLLKISTIQEIGRFTSFKHKAPLFESFVLIYARNGYGKSTFCSLLRSAADQDAKLITARRRLGALKESRIETLWQSSGVIEFASGEWTKCPGDLHIFDSEYIRRNVHTADAVTRENKRNLIPVVLGAYGVQLAKMISELDSEQRDCSNKQSAIEKAIKLALPAVDDVARFIATSVPENIDQQISTAERALEFAKQAAAIQLKSLPREIVLRSFESYKDISASDLGHVSERAAELVKSHIDDHGMTPNGERWLKYGVDHIKGNECPFCTQDLSAVDLVSVFKGYFSADYAALTSNIEDSLNELIEFYGESGERITQILDQNSADFLFWAKVTDISSPPSLGESEKTKIKEGLEQLRNMLKQKSARPLSQAGFDNAPAQAALDILADYNSAVSQCVSVISEARRKIDQPDAAAALQILNKKKALKEKTTDRIRDEIDSWRATTLRRSEIEIEKKSAQEKLRSHMASEIATRQNGINDLLEAFGASFRIVNTKASFIGREASTEFSVSIGSHTVKAGEHSPDTPSFTTVLSSGDKFTLALAFFIAQVRADPNLANAKIVLDDPFNSQDMQRQWETTSQIRSLAATACQVIVLSHDPRFLALIEKNSSSSKSYQLTCDDEGEGSLSIWSSEDELKDIYIRQAQRIREFATKGQFLKDSNAESLIKDLRPFLEDFIRTRYPGRFAQRMMLDGMASEIEAAGPSDPLYRNVPSFRALNEYSRDNMHGGASVPDPGQLRAQCVRVHKIIGPY